MESQQDKPHQPVRKRREQAFYRPEDVAGVDYGIDLGNPGEFPFTRGIYAEMYGRKLWTMRQYAGYGTAKESNERYRYLLKQGITGLSVAFDLPTQIGLDSDHGLAVGEVGRVGVAIDSLQDMEALFDGIPLGEVSCSMTINATAAVVLALYLVVAERQGVDWKALRGTVQNDILKEYLARGTYIHPPAESMRLVTDIFSFCRREVPRWNTISISGYHVREAGSTAAQEIAFTIANAEAYVEEAVKAGLEVDEFAPRLSFFFNAHNDFMEEVAKFRAARKIWARLMKDRFAARNRKSCMLRFHAQTAGSTLTAHQAENNSVRVAFQALAAILGGAQSLHTNARDEALALPSELTAQLALRTQQILAFETGVPEVADPLGGSWYLESLTLRLEEEATDYVQQIREMGGMVRAIETGFVQREIQNAAYVYQKQVESRKRVVVGVNRFASGEEPSLELLKIDPDIEERQIRQLTKLKRRRDSGRVQEALRSVGRAASASDNLMPPILDAVRSYATVGEISNILRQVLGEHRESVVI